ncbi:hypothetical protein EDB89DRAFT_1914618 [Lactarius sanguifluus]|nr:hypothetical protein EDB89DRAFT_1914618 [Lactarius sanguifluus]
MCLYRLYWHKLISEFSSSGMLHSAQLAFNLPFDSARWKGAKYSQYFGLSLKPGNQWCFLLIREIVGKCSWNSRGSSSVSQEGHSLDWFRDWGRRGQEGHPLGWLLRSGLLLGTIEVKRVVLLSGYLGWVFVGIVKVKRVFLLGGYLGCITQYLTCSKSGFFVVLGKRPSLGVVKVKRVVLLIGYYIFL